MRHEDRNETAQADVRVIVDLLNQVLNENYALRRKLERHRTTEAASERCEVSAAPAGTSTEALNDPAIAEDSSVVEPPSVMQMGVPKDRKPSLRHHSALAARRPRRQRVISRREHERISSQLENLTSELQSLRTEIRSTRMPSTEASSQSASLSAPAATRFQPIRNNHVQYAFEVDHHPSMWMKLHEPWFYVPLIWATILGALILAAFLFLYR